MTWPFVLIIQNGISLLIIRSQYCEIVVLSIKSYIFIFTRYNYKYNFIVVWLCLCVTKQRILHIIGHYVQKKEDVIHSVLETWIPKHKTWITYISADILNMKKRCVDDYLYDLVQPSCKWDEIGVSILSGMFHLHVRILMENTFWTSAIDNDLNTYKIYIAVTDKGCWWGASTMP